MRRYYIASGALLTLLVINFAVAAPALLQEKRQAGVDVVHTPKVAITMLRNRGYELNELWPKLFDSPPSGPASASGWAEVGQPLPTIPEEPSPVSIPDHAPPNPGSLTESIYKSMKGGAPPGPAGPASSTMSPAGHESMGAHGLPNPGPSTESDHEMVDALPTESDYQMANVPPSSSVSSTKPNRQSMGADSSSGKRKKIKLTQRI